MLLIEISNMQPNQSIIEKMKQITSREIRDVEKKLHEIQDRITHNDMRNAASYGALFSIARLVAQAQSFVFLNSDILEQFTLTLRMLFNSCAFDEQPSLGDTRVFNGGEFRNFLYDFYGVDNTEPLTSVLQAWRLSPYGEHRDANFCKDQVFATIYFNVLKQAVSTCLERNAEFIQSIIEIGQTDFREFLNFLINRDVPFSGPYRKDVFGETKLQVFMSSFDEVQNVANRGKPLFGIFEFPIHSLKMLPKDGKDYADGLPEMPFWIRHIPPAFNKPIETLRKYIT